MAPLPQEVSGKSGIEKNSESLSRKREREGPVAQRWEGEGPV